MACITTLRCHVCNDDLHECDVCSVCGLRVCSQSCLFDGCVEKKRGNLVICKKCGQDAPICVKNEEKLHDWMITQLGYTSLEDLIIHGYGTQHPEEVIPAHHASFIHYSKSANEYKICNEGDQLTEDEKRDEDEEEDVKEEIFIIIEEKDVKGHEFRSYIGTKSEIITKLKYKYSLIEGSMNSFLWPIQIGNVTLHRIMCSDHPYAGIVATHSFIDVAWFDTYNEAHDYLLNEEIDYMEQHNILCKIEDRRCSYIKLRD